VDLNLGESDRPNRIGKGTCRSDVPSGRRGPDYPWFNVRDFEEVPCGDPTAGASCNASIYGFDPFQFGNSGRNILDGPGLMTVDLGIRKNFRMAERRSIQVRLDCLNVLNRTNFRLPNNSFNQVTGGLITQVGASGREGGPRVFQAALSFTF